MKTNPDAVWYRVAVRTRAGQLARARVKEDLRALGYRPQNYTCAALARMAESYIRAYLEQAAEEVTQFARPGCTELKTNVQARSPQTTGTSVAHNSCSKEVAQ
jgi:hypothetical protein